MKERPILFSAPMIPPVLGGRKTQTRRVMRPQPPAGWFAESPDELREPGDGVTPRWLIERCPHGAPGDRLWVREGHYRFGHWEPVDGARKRTRTGRQRWRFVADRDEVRFDAPADFRKGRHHKDPATPAWHKRLARFMPRAFSRIRLEIAEVRVQRLQDISEDDARAEGMSPSLTHPGLWHNPLPEDERSEDYVASAREAFGLLWQQINGERAPWSSNPWVWAVTFRKVS